MDLTPIFLFRLLSPSVLLDPLKATDAALKTSGLGFLFSQAIAPLSKRFLPCECVNFY